MVAKKTADHSAPTRPAAAPAGPGSAPEAAAGEDAPGKAAAKKAAPGKTAAKKTAAKKTAKKAAKKTARKAAAGEAAPARKSAAKKTAARKTAEAAPAAQGAAEAAEQTGARTVATKKTAAGSAVGLPPARTAAAAPPDELAVRPGEDPWTPEEVTGARTELEGEAARLTAEITSSENALVGLMRDSGDGAGDDEADTGTKNITREHELALAANAREMLEQTERALERLDAGTYGLCESCGKPIGKARMQAFPRATLCVECKQKQERRG
ncbi:hypothetical protein GCM10023329_38360 [Streptomyces sanyensis]|uniref:Zinc finger DksA/TraR C4-type domain-containing protein n=1 Tax=Streptomyces sanyensis TaxID=568869 RepID=A0ABP9AQE9_9ACTN